jgi:hypothetical protein
MSSNGVRFRVSPRGARGPTIESSWASSCALAILSTEQEHNPRNVGKARTSVSMHVNMFLNSPLGENYTHVKCQWHFARRTQVRA